MHCEIIYDLTKILILWSFKLNCPIVDFWINALQMNACIINAESVHAIETKRLACFFQNIEQSAISEVGQYSG